MTTDPHPLGAAALSPCPNPWCHYADDQREAVCINPDMREKYWQVKCLCGIDGPYEATEAEAIAAWNSRRPTAPSQEGEKRVIDDATGSTVPGPFCSGVVAEMRLNHVTAALVNGFMIELAWKLAKAEVKYGYTDGWAQDGWEDECRRQLHHHAAKGDPLDVAAYAAFCWRHGWSTAHPAKPVDGEVLGVMRRLVDASAALVVKAIREPADEAGLEEWTAAVTEARALLAAALPLGGEDMADLSKTDRLSGSLVTEVDGATPYRSPTPWSYRPYRHDDWGVVRDAQGWPVCQASTNALPNDTDLGVFRRSGTDPVEGNARLIASAPELLEALRRLTFAARTTGGVPGPDQPLIAACERAESAIAKAQGTTPPPSADKSVEG